MPATCTRAPCPRILLLMMAVAMVTAGCTPRASATAASAAVSSRQAQALAEGPDTPGQGSAEAAVRRTYEALASHDQARTRQALDPVTHQAPYDSSALSVALGLLRLPGDVLAGLSFEELQYAELRRDGVWAEVRVRGLIRNAALATSVPLDATEVVHQVDGRWYTSAPKLYASRPEGAAYAARIQTLNRDGCH